MACRSASVQRAQEKSERALQAILNLAKNIVDLAESEERSFEAEISKTKDDIQVHDLKLLKKHHATKIDFTHEFDVDLLVPVIENILKAASLTVGGPATVAVLLNPASLKIYANLMNSITEAVKTKSMTGASAYFAMTKLSPGFFGFTSTRSLTISDKDTFGKESITAFNFSYELYHSETDESASNELNQKRIIQATIEKTLEAKLGLVDKLMSGEITPDQFELINNYLTKSIEESKLLLHEMTGEEIHVKGLWNQIKSPASTEDKMDPIYQPAEIQKILNQANAFFQTKEAEFGSMLQNVKELKAQFGYEDHI